MTDIDQPPAEPVTIALVVDNDPMAARLADIARAARRTAIANGWESSSSAIACVRITGQVLARLGIQSVPWSLAPAWLSAEAARTQMASGHSVGVSGTGTVDRATKRWDGHVGLLVEGRYLLDVSAQQFSRPAAGIPIGGPLAARLAEPFDPGLLMTPGTVLAYQRRDGVEVLYRVMETQDSYQDSPDWQGKNAQVEHTVRMVVASLAARDEAPSVPRVTQGEHMKCAVCGRGLNDLSLPDGSTQYLHTRPWEPVDHDPVPVPMGDPESADIVCDFCSDPDPAWLYTGPNLSTAPGTQTSRQMIKNLGGPDGVANNSMALLGEQWSACDACDRYVTARDLDGLFWSSRKSRHNRPTYQGLPRATVMSVYHDLMDVWNRYIPHITARRSMRRNAVPTLYARQLPKIHHRLIRLMEQSGFGGAGTLWGALGHVNVPGPDAGRDDDVHVRVPVSDAALDALTTRVANGLHAAEGELYWISRDFTRLAQSAGQDMSVITVRREELPSPNGLVVWEEPIMALPPDETGEGEALIVGASWTVVSGLGVWVVLYAQSEQFLPYADSPRETFGYLLPIGSGSGLSFFDEYEASGRGEHDAVWQTLLATWFLITQPGVAVIDEQESNDKPLIKRAKRAGRRVPSVRVINLRRHARSAGTRGEEAGERRQVSVRFMVRGHWRRQAYGPKRGMRKTMYIAPFIKGPDGAPLQTDRAPVVKALR